MLYKTVEKDKLINDGDRLDIIVSLGKLDKEQLKKDGINELGNVPIMMYHGIREKDENAGATIGGNVDKDGYNRTPEAFRKDLEFYYEKGYRMIRLIDYVNGVKDIKKGIIRPVIPLKQIFVEDPVRMLRAIKYAATTGFKIPRKLHKKIIKSAHLLSPVSPSRLTEELLKIINSGHSYQIVKNALKTDLYIYLLISVVFRYL